MIIATTERLVLRSLEEHDAEMILLLNSDPEVLRYVHDEPFADVHAARHWILDVPRQLPRGLGMVVAQLALEDAEARRIQAVGGCLQHLSAEASGIRQGEVA